jgi:hypothetical protein
MGHSDPQQGLIVRLPKVEGDPDPEIVVAKDEHACMDTFLAAKKVWEWSQEMEEEG